MKKLLIGLWFVFGFGLVQAQKADMLLPIKQNGKWGYINTRGEVVISPIYDRTEAFEMNRFAKVVKDGVVQIIDRKGNILQGLKFDDMTVLEDSVVAIKKNGKWGAATINGEILIEPAYDKISRSNSRNSFLYKQDEKNGLVSRSGKILVPAEYDSVYTRGNFYLAKAFSGIIIYGQDAKPLLTDTANQVSVFADTLIFFKSDTLWGAVSVNKSIIIQPQWEGFAQLRSNYFLLKLNGGERLYSLSARKIIADENTSEFDVLADNNVTFWSQSGMGLMDESGKIILNPVYEAISYSGAYIIITQNGLDGFASRSGKIILKPKYEFVQAFDEDVPNATLVSNKNKWGVVNARGKEIIPVTYSNIKLYADLARAQKGKSIWMFDIDESGNVTATDEFTNVMAVSVTARRRGGNGIESNADNANSKKGGWFRSTENLKWGFRDTSGKVLIRPQFDRVQHHPDLKLTMVSNRRARGINVELGNSRIRYEYLFGLIEDSTLKLIAPVVYTSIKLRNWQNKKASYATASTVNGDFVLLFRDGTTTKKRYTFVDEANGSLTRVAHKGKLVLVYPENDNTVVCTFWDYIRGIEGISYDIGRTRFPAGEPKLTTKDSKWGFINNNGEEVLPCAYDFVLPLVKGKSIAVKENKWGVIDSNGTEIIPFKYHYISYLHKTNTSYFQLAVNNAKYGLVSLDGSEKASPMYGKLGNVSEGLMWMKTGKKYTFISTDGDTITDSKMRRVRNYSDGMAAISTRTGWTYLNTNGEQAFKETFIAGGDFHYGMAWVIKNNKRGYINKDGEILIAPKYSKAGDFNEHGLAIVANKKYKFGIINTEGKKVRWCRFQSITPHSEGIAIAKTKHKFILYDAQGKRIKALRGYYEIQPFNEGMAAVRKLGKNGTMAYGFINTNGDEVIPAQHKPCYKFSDGVCVVGDKNSALKVVITPDGDSLFDKRLNIVGHYADGFAVVKKPDNNFYYVDKQGNNKFNRSFTQARPFEHGYAKVQTGKKWGLIDTNGITIVSPKYDDMGAISDGMVTVKLNYFYGMADSTGKLLANPDFSTIRFLPELSVFQVESGNSVGYLHTNGTWLWEMKE